MVVMTPDRPGLGGPPTGIEWKLTPGLREADDPVLLRPDRRGQSTGLFEHGAAQGAGRNAGQEASASPCRSAPPTASRTPPGDVSLKVAEDDAKQIEPNTVTVMIDVEEIAQKTVSVYLLDATSGAELASSTRSKSPFRYKVSHARARPEIHVGLRGKVVRKDLVRKVKVGANVPVFVLEYLLGKYCATDDPAAIDAGLGWSTPRSPRTSSVPTRRTRPSRWSRTRASTPSSTRCKVRYLSDDDKHWAELVNFGHKYVHIPEHYLRDFDRLLMGGIWAQVDIRHQYDEEAKGKRSPFWIDGLKPIQLATFDLDEYRECRRQFTTDEWIDLLLRSVGMEPSHFDRRLKLLFLIRLLPLCEQNYNLVELGPRGTGKSYAYQELSPYVDPADRPDDGRQPVLQHGDRQDGAGRHLGRHRLRRGGRPPEDAQGGRDDAQDLLRVGNVRPRQGRPVGAWRPSPCSATRTSRSR